MFLIILINSETSKDVTAQRLKITHMFLAMKDAEGIMCGSAELWRYSLNSLLKKSILHLLGTRIPILNLARYKAHKEKKNPRQIKNHPMN